MSSSGTRGGRSAAAALTERPRPLWYRLKPCPATGGATCRDHPVGSSSSSCTSTSYLAADSSAYGAWTYLILFVSHLLRDRPGRDAVPARRLAALRGGRDRGARRARTARAVLSSCSVAAILGDACNYWIGTHFRTEGAAARRTPGSSGKSYLDKTPAFFERYGGKTIVLARFVPIVRTFAPFLAGVGTMRYRHFFVYNVVGGVAWVALFIGRRATSSATCPRSSTTSRSSILAIVASLARPGSGANGARREVPQQGAEARTPDPEHNERGAGRSRTPLGCRR